MDFPKVESVHNDIDFSMKVTRQAFESTCADMKVRFVQPIYDALDNANLTLVRVFLVQHGNMMLKIEWDRRTSILSY
jgi:hypoxia up-regulated 1